MKLGKFNMVNKRVNQLTLNEITYPHQSGRYAGTSVGRDREGYFVTTHRARSKSYPNPIKIPDSKIKVIKSTG